MNDIKDLLARTALRDRAAFATLYERTSGKLFGTVLRILRDRPDAEEALQEVYIKIWQRAGTYQAANTSPISWLATIARNHAIDVIRARRPVSDDIDVAMEIADDAPTPEQSAVSGGERGQIDHCLEQLQPDRAEAVRAAYLDGFSYQELAGRYAVPLNTMKTQLRRSLLKLKECLSL